MPLAAAICVMDFKLSSIISSEDGPVLRRPGILREVDGHSEVGHRGNLQIHRIAEHQDAGLNRAARLSSKRQHAIGGRIDFRFLCACGYVG